MNYSKIYDQIVDRARRRIIPHEDIEVYHILPKSMDGSDDDVNLVPLTSREHFIAHLLLVKMTEGTPHHQKMAFASYMMCQRGRYASRVTSKVCESLCKSANKYDTTIYEVVHRNGDNFSGTQTQLRSHILSHPSCIHRMINNPGSETRGWRLSGTEVKTSGKHDLTIFKIVNREGDVLEGTRRQLKGSISSYDIKYIADHPGRERKGWRIYGSSTILRHNESTSEYSFTHKDGSKFTGTRKEMMLTNRLSHAEMNNMINIGGTAKGWTLLPLH